MKHRKSLAHQLSEAKLENAALGEQINDLRNMNINLRQRDNDRLQAESKRPFRRMIVVLEDAKGRTIAHSETFINKGDEVSASVDHEGNILITTSNSER